VKRKKSHTKLKIFSGDIHFPKETDKILDGSLIPPEREKKILRNQKRKRKIGIMFNGKKFSKAKKSILFWFDLQSHMKCTKGEI